MRRFTSCVLALVMTAGLSNTALAAQQGWNYGTQVEYIATTVETWTVTVPAQLAPEESGDVDAQGTWAGNRKLVVTADTEVELINNLNAAETAMLDIYFDGISQLGNNTNEINVTEQISVGAIENALFGTWSGKFNYTVSMIDATFVGWNYNGYIIKEKIPEDIAGCRDIVLSIIPTEMINMMFPAEIANKISVMALASVTREPGTAVYDPSTGEVCGYSLDEGNVYLCWYLECIGTLTIEEEETLGELIGDFPISECIDNWYAEDGGYVVGYGTLADYVKWSNYDIINEADGSVFMGASSEPYKVYE